MFEIRYALEANMAFSVTLNTYISENELLLTFRDKQTQINCLSLVYKEHIG